MADLTQMKTELSRLQSELQSQLDNVRSWRNAVGGDWVEPNASGPGGTGPTRILSDEEVIAEYEPKLLELQRQIDNLEQR